MKPKPKEHWQFSSADTSVESIISRFLHKLRYTLGKDTFSATAYDCYAAFALTVRDYLTDNWIRHQQAQYAVDAKRVYYLSLEFLTGRALENALLNLDLIREARTALGKLGFDMSELIELEWVYNRITNIHKQGIILLWHPVLQRIFASLLSVAPSRYCLTFIARIRKLP